MRNLSPEFLLLGCLALGPSHGYRMHQRLSADLPHLWQISQSQMYNILARLERQGLIESITESQQRLPDRRCFHLTPAGRHRFEIWLHTPTQSGLQAIRLNFVSRLYFAQLLEKETIPQLIQAQVDETVRTLSRLQETLAVIPPEQTFNRMGLELRIRHLTVMLEWFTQCAVTLSSHPSHAAR